MRLRRLPTVTFGLFAALLVLGGPVGPGRLQAQTIPSPYEFIDERHEVGLFAGNLWSDRGPLRLSPSAGGLVGARYAVRLSGPLAIEAAGFVASSEREVYDPAASGEHVLLGVTESRLLGLEARLRLTLTGSRTWRGVAPFVLIGAGIASDLGDGTDLEAGLSAGERFSFGPSPLITTGAGARWYPSRRMSVRVDGLFHLWRVATPPAFVTASPDGDVSDRRWVRSLGVTAGVQVAF